MSEQKAPRRRLTKAELVAKLTEKIEFAIRNGATPEQALDALTVKQYDFLIDNGFNPDSLTLTAEQQEAVKQLVKAGRPKFPNGYSKKYPEAKQALFQGIIAHLTAQGAEIIPREKENFRDLDFTIEGKHYRIVLSSPRK